MSKLHVVATPIGNLGDLSPRGLEALKTASLIACEDTRRTWALLTHFGIPRPEMVSYRQGNEERLTERIITAVKSGAEVVLCSDGGYPILFIHGKKDDFVPFEMSERNYEACISEKKRFFHVDEAGHGMCYLSKREELQNEIIAFFDDCQTFYKEERK